jgi:hypothetical protein
VGAWAGVSAAPLPDFAHYPATGRDPGKSARVILADADQRLFRTRLRTATHPADFAGGWVLALWGCGADCLYGGAVERKSGRVVLLPGSVCCWWASPTDKKLLYRRDSRLLVARGFINEGERYGTHYFEFTGREFRLLRFVPADRVAHRRQMGETIRRNLREAERERLKSPLENQPMRLAPDRTLDRR